MSKSKGPKWIAKIDYKVCLRINKKYYRKKDQGLLLKFFVNPLTYLSFLIRAVLILLRGFNFESKSLPLKKGITLKENFLELLARFFGLRFFVHPKYLPAYYHIALQDDQLNFKKYDSPKVSIIIPVHNQFSHTITCLKSLKINLTEEIPYEIIVVNDASSDQTKEILGKVKGLNLINNDTNLGFLHSCQRGITMASSPYICLLNNDTIILDNWLSELVKTIERDSSIGLVGSKLIYPFGLLQEAGGLVYNDASACNFGNYGDLNYFAYNFSRETDYCSGASILFRKEDFNLLGGFDERFAPAYYEDTDLCLSIKNVLNKKVVYQPLSSLVHFEGASSGKTAKKGNIKSYQDINKEKFFSKWKEVLRNHASPNDPSAYRRYLKSEKIVVIDWDLPLFDKDSGSYRMYQLLKIFKELDLQIVFITNKGVPQQPYYDLLVGNGIEVIVKYIGRRKFREDIISAAKDCTYVWASRPENNQKYSYIKDTNEKAKWFYDTVDLHYVRLQRDADLTGSAKKKELAEYYKALELNLAKLADTTICITDIEQTMLQKEGIKNTVVIPNIHEIISTVKDSYSFSERKDLLFIGSYAHEPNTDAVKWLCNEIMPIVWAHLPQIKIHLVGSNPTDQVLALQNQNIIVHGYVENLDEIFNSCRLFVAPLRYGAGMKGKIGQALSYGLPIVTTDIGAEGMSLENEKQILLANTSQTFANAIIKLYQSETLWYHLHNNAEDAIANFSPESAKKAIISILSNQK